MPRRSNRFGRFLLLSLLLPGLTMLPAALAQQPSPPPPPPAQPPAAQAPASRPVQQGPGGYSIQRDVNLVVLHAAVINQRGEFVPGLTQDSFKVYEDKAEQMISVFRQEDVPVSMGLVIDNSGSMREKRPLVNAAALTLVKTSNAQDEAFVVNFNDDYYLDTVHDFTNDLTEMKDALERIDARGSTALYDAVIGSLDHLKKGHKDKKVLLVITDGVDNASRRTLDNAVQEAQKSDAIIYAVGLFGSDMKGGEIRKARKALTDLTTATGGLAFFPENVEDTESICAQVAHDIRNQYTIAYYPTNAAHDGTFRSVMVTVAPQRVAGKLSVRTRSGYYAGPAASGN
jgi:Ca-activated chloride channel family protein